MFTGVRSFATTQKSSTRDEQLELGMVALQEEEGQIFYASLISHNSILESLQV